MARASAAEITLSLFPDSMAAFVRAVLRARRVVRATVSLAFIAVLRSSIMVSAKVLMWKVVKGFSAPCKHGSCGRGGL